MTKPESTSGGRRYLRFSLRTLLIAITVFALWFGYQSDRAMKQRRAVAMVLSYGGEVMYTQRRASFGNGPDSLEPWAPTWLRKLLGDDYFVTVCAVDMLPPKSMQDWKFRGYEEMTDEEFALLGGLPSVETLRITGRVVTDQRMQSLRPLTILYTLAIEDATITDASMATIGRFAQLCNLDITPDNVYSRSSSKELQITDEGMRALYHLQSLERVVLGRSQIGDQGLEALCGLKAITALYLKEAPNVTNVGIAHLSTLSNLQILCLRQSEITDECLGTIGQLKLLLILDLTENQITDAGIAQLAGLPKLRHLYVSHTAVTGATLADLNSLAYLVLNNTPVSDETLAAICKLSTLLEVYLFETKVTDAGLATLASLPALSTIGLKGTDVSDAGLASLKSLPLAELYLEKTNVTEAAADKLRNKGVKVYTDVQPSGL